jgi:non-heme chloroperoxidase
MSAIERWTIRSGPRIRYLDNSPTEPVGLPILFSPGVTDTADEYAEALEFFAPRRLLVVEVRGRGTSEAPLAGYTAAEHADDLQAVLEEEGIERFHMMTFSRGTTWALDLVLRDPRRVATVSIGDYWPGEIALSQEAAERMMATRFRGRPMHERVQPHVLPALFEASTRRDLAEDLAASGLPVLVAIGTEPGRLITADAVRDYQDRIPGVEVTVIEGASHDLFRPDRLAYARAVLDFINRRAADATTSPG